MQHADNIKSLKSLDADRYLGFPPGTLKLARHTGTLYSQEPPPFIKIGRSVLYVKEDLDIWLNQFKKFRNNAEASQVNGTVC